MNSAADSAEAPKYIKSEPMPVTLWHYTKINSFINILRNGCIWFSDYRVLNDSTEFQYGIGVVIRLLQSLSDNENNVLQKALLERLVAFINRTKEGAAVYVFCLTSNEDSLTHWQGYSGLSEPIAIGFISLSLNREMWQGYRAQLVPVIYEQTQQEQLVRQAINSFIANSQCGLFLDGTEPDIDTIDFELFALECFDLCVQFKNPKFSDEKEWRLVTRFAFEHGPFGELKYRSNGFGIRPYLEMEANHKMLPIDRAIVGPMSFATMQIKLLDEFMRRHDYFDFELRVSEVPLRS